MTTIITRFPNQAERIAKELRSANPRPAYAIVSGCLIQTDATPFQVIEAGFRTGVQAESMAGVSP